MEMAGRNIIVTGAGSGLGRAASRRLAREGAVVGLLGRTEDELVEVRDEIDRDGGRATVLVADIAEEAALRQAVDGFADRHGGLDGVFANAGINGTWAPVDELAPHEFDRTVAVNLRGTFLTLHCTVPHLKAKGGAIVVTSSINGTRTFSNPGTIAYAATKAAQVAMGQVLALELARHRIRVNVICPGAIETEIDDNTERRDVAEAAIPRTFPEGQIPLTGGRPGSAAEVAELVLFLLSDRSRHITGTPVWIDGGQSLLI